MDTRPDYEGVTKEIRFIVYCMENYKVHRGLNGKAVLELFSTYGVFDYLREFYDLLHTTGHQYINNDIDIYLRSRGVVLG